MTWLPAIPPSRKTDPNEKDHDMNLADAARNQIDPLTVSGPATVELEHLCRQRISQWWERAGLEPSFPAADGDAVALCRAVDYEIDAESFVRFWNNGAFFGVAISEGRRNWSAIDIVRLATFLECRRAWMPGSELHRAKKTPYEVALENLRATGEAHEFFNDLEKYDLRALLLMMTEADNRQQREALKVAIEIKLESFDIIV